MCPFLLNCTRPVHNTQDSPCHEIIFNTWLQLPSRRPENSFTALTLTVFALWTTVGLEMSSSQFNKISFKSQLSCHVIVFLSQNPLKIALWMFYPGGGLIEKHLVPIPHSCTLNICAELEPWHISMTFLVCNECYKHVAARRLGLAIGATNMRASMQEKLLLFGKSCRFSYSYLALQCLCILMSFDLLNYFLGSVYLFLCTYTYSYQLLFCWSLPKPSKRSRLYHLATPILHRYSVRRVNTCHRKSHYHSFCQEASPIVEWVYYTCCQHTWSITILAVSPRRHRRWGHFPWATKPYFQLEPICFRI